MKLLIGILLTFLGQAIIWFQGNGQFVWDWFRKNPLIVSIIFGTLVSYVFILGNRYLVTYFNGLLWPARLVGFGMGMVVFTILTWLFMGETLNTKSLVSLTLSVIIVLIQIFWK